MSRETSDRLSITDRARRPHTDVTVAQVRDEGPNGLLSYGLKSLGDGLVFGEDSELGEDDSCLLGILLAVDWVTQDDVDVERLAGAWNEEQESGEGREVRPGGYMRPHMQGSFGEV